METFFGLLLRRVCTNNYKKYRRIIAFDGIY